MQPERPFVSSLSSPDASLARVGGKGQSLAKLAMAGLPVPAGFFVTTNAYSEFVTANDLRSTILKYVDGISGEPASLDHTSTSIRALFEHRTIPIQVVNSISHAYETLGNEPAVAVRSSATAEDLPDQSFAGQQDTFLNVFGPDAVVDAVRRCWSSLWTARAIGYRARQGIDHACVSMGVVVQVMVPAEVSGVLFTANPVTGERNELVINASFGLGEAIVSGSVTPDTFLLNRNNGALKERQLGRKEAMVVSASGQGISNQAVPEHLRSTASLSPEQLTELRTLSLDVEGLFDGTRQDIEWAFANGKCWLLQSRPITNLPPQPLPDVWDPPIGVEKLIRRQVVENMPDPLSPLFEELYLLRGLDQSMDSLMTILEMPIDINLFIERPMFLTVNGYAYSRADYRISWQMLRAMPRILYFYVTGLPRLLKDLVPMWKDHGLVEYLELVERWKQVDPATVEHEELLNGIRDLSAADALYWFYVSFVMGAAKITDGLLHWFLSRTSKRQQLTSGMFLQGFPSKTLEAQESLERIAGRIRGDDSVRKLVYSTPAGELLSKLDDLPIGDEIRAHLSRFGHQIYTLDFVEPTQLEDPLPFLMSLRAMVKVPPDDISSRQAQLIADRRALEKATLESFGPIRRRLFRTFLRWAQKFGPHREEALFYVGAAWPVLRRLAFELGSRLTRSGSLSRKEDVFFLTSSEIDKASTAQEETGSFSDYRELAQQRRDLRESRKALHPPGFIPVGDSFKIGPFSMKLWETQKRNEDETSVLEGFPVSPGKINGSAVVIMSPSDFEQMTPGSILVCPTTTPAWTPLFSQAVGLVTDIGGILAHGSIVAREYGIPAVLGTGNATQRIATGQQITVDGNAGTVTLDVAPV